MRCTIPFVRLVVVLGLIVAVVGAFAAPHVATAAPVEQTTGVPMAFQDDDDDDDDDGGGGVVAVPRTGVGTPDGFDNAGAPLFLGMLAALFAGAAYLRRDGLLTR